jgi:hypothetical protein
VEHSGDGSGDGSGTLTARGSACAAFADGHPLIVGTIIADGWLPQLSQAEVRHSKYGRSKYGRSKYSHSKSSGCRNSARSRCARGCASILTMATPSTTLLTMAGVRAAVPLYLLWLHLVPHYLLWQVCAWLCLFIKDSRLAEVDSKEQPLPKPSAALQEVFGATFELAEILEVQLNTTDPHPNPNPNPNPDPHPNPNPNPNSNPGPDPNPNPSQVELDTNLSLIMLDWYEHKDITRYPSPSPSPSPQPPPPPP